MHTQAKDVYTGNGTDNEVPPVRNRLTPIIQRGVVLGRRRKVKVRKAKVYDRELLDSKVVRYVRTPAGVARFHKPVGSIILGEGSSPLKNITALPNDIPGWQKIQGPDKTPYYIGKDPEKGGYVAVDMHDDVIAEGSSPQVLLEGLDRILGKPKVKFTPAAPKVKVSVELTTADQARVRAAKVRKGEADKAVAKYNGTISSINSGKTTIDEAFLDTGIDLTPFANDQDQLPKDLKPEEVAAQSEWLSTLDGCRMIRQAADNLLGFKGASATDPHRRRRESSYGAPISNTAARRDALVLLKGLRDAQPSDRPMFRGVGHVPSGMLRALQVGNTFDMPLVSFTDGERVAARFGTDVMFVLDHPAKVIKGASFGMRSDGRAAHEYISGGRFVVSKVDKSASGALTVHIVQAGVFDPDTAMLTKDDQVPSVWEYSYLFDKPLAKERKPRPMPTSNKSIVDLASLIYRGMELKVVRHVRTPEGVKRYKQPIGAVIVRDGAAPLSHLKAVKNDYPGWEKLQGSDGKNYYVGKDPENNKVYVAVDNTDNVIAEGPKEEKVYEDLNALVAKKGGKPLFIQGTTPQAPKTTARAAKPEASSGPAKIPDGAHWLEPAPKGAPADTQGGLPLTPEAWAKIKETYPKANIPPAYVGVVYNPDYKNPEATWITKGIAWSAPKRRYVWQTQRSVTAANKADAAKYLRNKEFASKVATLGKKVNQDMPHSDVALAVGLMMRTGMRVDSMDPDARDEGAEVYGATSILVGQIKVSSPNKATITFTGKHHVLNTYTITNPALIAALQQRMKGKKPGDKILSGVDSKKTLAYIGSAIGKASDGSPFKNHDVRTYVANTIALDEINKLPVPKTKAEFTRQRRQVAEVVSQQLNNRPAQALKSYIDPLLFKTWEDSING